MAKKKMTIEDLAIITKHGFDTVDKRFERKKHFVYRYEFEDALGRIAHIEKNLGIKSGK